MQAYTITYYLNDGSVTTMTIHRSSLDTVVNECKKTLYKRGWVVMDARGDWLANEYA